MKIAISVNLSGGTPNARKSETDKVCPYNKGSPPASMKKYMIRWVESTCQSLHAVTYTAKFCTRDINECEMRPGVAARVMTADDAVEHVKKGQIRDANQCDWGCRAR